MYIHREYDFLDYESGEVSSTKCSSEPLYALKMISTMKRDETTIEKTADIRCTHAKRCETCEQMKRQPFSFIDTLETGV